MTAPATPLAIDPRATDPRATDPRAVPAVQAAPTATDTAAVRSPDAHNPDAHTAARTPGAPTDAPLAPDAPRASAHRSHATAATEVDRADNPVPLGPAHREPAAPPIATTVRDAAAPTAPRERPDASAESSLDLTSGKAHLVVGEGDQRVVVDIAMRGDALDVAMRTRDDHLAGQLSRGSDQLHDALRGHGLALGTLTAQADTGNAHTGARPDPRGARPDAGDARDGRDPRRVPASIDPLASDEPGPRRDPHLRALA